jgi:hypothetical protein
MLKYKKYPWSWQDSNPEIQRLLDLRLCTPYILKREAHTNILELDPYLKENTQSLWYVY